MTTRPMAPATTLAAYRALKSEKLRDQILELIEAAGAEGLIGDDVREVFADSDVKDGSINTRFSELERAGLICRNGDTRPGASGRQQLILRSARFAAPVAPSGTHPAAGKRRRSAFLAGLMYAAKMAATASDLPTLKSTLKHELLKAAKRTT